MTSSMTSNSLSIVHFLTSCFDGTIVSDSSINSKKRLSHKEFLGFRIACSEGHLAAAKHILSQIQYHFPSTFDCACMAADEYAFRHAAINGHLHVAEWLVQTYNVSPRCSNDYVFRELAKRGNVNSIQWFLTRFPSAL